ncbi:MAG: dTDP-4-amino-4,6-dideoxygalactose transaminase [Sphingobacteriales bacterium]|jgi:dTDP-4-amino-4,6-dideoxygalactose transaminase|nr:dTDP-4-amino-4,6-dideoxygalactose transaminase [Sphingobacteriales bacterium]
MYHQQYQIPFNKPFLTGKETDYIREAVASGKISGDGLFTARCQAFFEARYGFSKTLLTTSCTDALEMCALLLNIKSGDEVIMPSFTFVSAANAFLLRGARLVFADSSPQHPNIDETQLESLITPRTRAIVLVHYGGMACNMNAIQQIAHRHGLTIIEDAAHATDARYCPPNETPQYLGGIGSLATFSFHETKNVMAGEGGLLVINDSALRSRAEIIREKGTNRAAFFRNEVAKYQWVDIGSSFLPSELIAAFLYAQLEQISVIQQKRIAIWQHYHQYLQQLPRYGVALPQMPSYAECNGHLYYIVCRSATERDQLIAYLKTHSIYTAFHYQSLHQSPFFQPLHDGRPLPYADLYSDRLLRLPLYYELELNSVEKICALMEQFYAS